MSLKSCVEALSGLRFDGIEAKTCRTCSHNTASFRTNVNKPIIIGGLPMDKPYKPDSKKYMNWRMT